MNKGTTITHHKYSNFYSTCESNEIISSKMQKAQRIIKYISLVLKNR
jgi:hypothetical protein